MGTLYSGFSDQYQHGIQKENSNTVLANNNSLSVVYKDQIKQDIVGIVRLLPTADFQRKVLKKMSRTVLAERFDLYAILREERNEEERKDEKNVHK